MGYHEMKPKKQEHRITSRRYMVQVLNEGRWYDHHLDDDLTRREARHEFSRVNLWGRKARIIERVEAFRVIVVRKF